MATPTHKFYMLSEADRKEKNPREGILVYVLPVGEYTISLKKIVSLLGAVYKIKNTKKCCMYCKAVFV